MIRSRRSGLSGASRAHGTPPSTPFAASFSITCAAIARHADGELVEERLVEHGHARHLAERIGERDRIGVIDAREPPQPGFAEQRQMDREGERAEPGIGADVRGRLLAPDVLLARREREHEAALAFGVDGLAGEPARHLPHEFLPRREQPDIGPAEISPLPID